MPPSIQRVGQYNFIKKLGIGRMAEVYLGRIEGAEGFQKPVAIKKILPSLSSDLQFVQSLIAEARVGGQLHHRNIVEVYDFIRYGTDYCIIMEYVDGVDLGRILRSARKYKVRIPPAAALFIALHICDGLEYAHSARGFNGEPLNIIHRDLKPSNILISIKGGVKISDFGIARVMEQAVKRGTGELKVSYQYQSPEQATGSGRITSASDIYSVGVILFEMLTLEPLFPGKNVLEVLDGLREAEFERRLALAQRQLPGSERILATALNPNPEARFVSAAQMAESLRKLLHVLKVDDPKERLVSFFTKLVRHVQEQGKRPIEPGVSAVREVPPSDDAETPSISGMPAQDLEAPPPQVAPAVSAAPQAPPIEVEQPARREVVSPPVQRVAPSSAPPAVPGGGARNDYPDYSAAMPSANEYSAQAAPVQPSIEGAMASRGQGVPVPQEPPPPQPSYEPPTPAAASYGSYNPGAASVGAAREVPPADLLWGGRAAETAAIPYAASGTGQDLGQPPYQSPYQQPYNPEETRVGGYATVGQQPYPMDQGAYPQQPPYAAPSPMSAPYVPPAPGQQAYDPYADPSRYQYPVPNAGPPARPGAVSDSTRIIPVVDPSSALGQPVYPAAPSYAPSAQSGAISDGTAAFPAPEPRVVPASSGRGRKKAVLAALAVITLLAAGGGGYAYLTHVPGQAATCKNCCPKCGREVPTDAPFCPYDGTEMKPGGESAQEITCPSCNQPNVPSAKFCEHCGKPLQVPK